ncbi:unnamed protein product [Paramecium octaurelia]|uniref:Uncharacterized protein n=1 Tax=Paramecium octaurelia TaxID=43137 RepID=A0A8S1VY21_PAROT|nr:unnamed protein product [Paramecium octaurelia]
MKSKSLQKKSQADLSISELLIISLMQDGNSDMTDSGLKISCLEGLSLERGRETSIAGKIKRKWIMERIKYIMKTTSSNRKGQLKKGFQIRQLQMSKKVRMCSQSKINNVRTLSQIPQDRQTHIAGDSYLTRLLRQQYH